MKRIHSLVAVVLFVALVLVAVQPIPARTENDDGQVTTKASEIQKAEVLLPETQEALADISVPPDAEVTPMSATSDYQAAPGKIVHAEARFQLVNRTAGEGEWSGMSELFEGAALKYLRANEDASLRELANGLLDHIAAERSRASGVTEDPDALWTSEAVVLASITVTSPYFIDLSSGYKGASVKQLQERLIQLGYMTGEADGHYGPITEAAIVEVKTRLRAMEQAAIDEQIAKIEAQATPAPTPAMDAQGEPVEVEPTPVPTPSTAVDGTADVEFQAFLFSDAFPVSGELIAADSSGDHVLRLQRGLIRLGYLTGDADGVYGGNTARAIRLFQHYNDLGQTGQADETMQKLLFSGDANPPSYPLMVVGSNGDEVRRLQQRLLTLGFMTGSADGDYGNNTKVGVENLQSYLRELERDQLIAEASSAPVTQGDDIIAPAPTEDNQAEPEAEAPIEIDESQLTVEVNGIADPLLLESFYDDSFPAIPDQMEAGHAGRDVKRVQRRLQSLEYLFTAPDGDYGGRTADAITKFQARNELPQTGIADQKTMDVLFSKDALKALKPYLLKVSIADQRVYAYGLDANNEHTVLVRTMKCSTGLNATPTPKGTFQGSTGPGARWHYFKKFKCWAQYAYYIQGDIMFHSVLYGSKGGAVTQSSVRNLGRKASHGCVRLSVEDAKWLYENCPFQTKIVVY